MDLGNVQHLIPNTSVVGTQMYQSYQVWHKHISFFKFITKIFSLSFIAMKYSSTKYILQSFHSLKHLYFTSCDLRYFLIYADIFGHFQIFYIYMHSLQILNSIFLIRYQLPQYDFDDWFYVIKKMGFIEDK